MRRILIVPVIAGILLAAGACGSKEETSTTASTVKASSSDSEKSSTTEAGGTDDTTEDDSDTGSDGPGSGGIGDLPSGLDDDCIAISTLYVTIMAKSTTAMVPGAMSADELEELQATLEEAKGKADVPDEIADAFAVWSEAWGEFGAAMSEMEGGVLNPENAAKFEELSETIEDPEVEAAGKEIEAYVTENCAAGGLVEEP
jgi:hypothetical protein